MTESARIKASECKCIICGRQAVAFWPVVDPDIPANPYCRKCLDKEKLKAMISVFGDRDGRLYFQKWNKENQDNGTAKK